MRSLSTSRGWLRREWRHELRINDLEQTWRIVYRVDSDAVIILDVFSKKTSATPKRVIDVCKSRIKRYDAAEE